MDDSEGTDELLPHKTPCSPEVKVNPRDSFPASCHFIRVHPWFPLAIHHFKPAWRAHASWCCDMLIAGLPTRPRTAST